MLGQRIGPYQIVRQLGAGGMGVVYEAIHEQLGRRAAIKVLHPHVARDEALAARFINEARAANIIDHPGIVQIFELGQLPDGAAYIVMELLRGESLRARMERAGGLGGPAAVRIVRQIGAALAAAHEKGIVHRDLKPDNVMLVPDPAAEGGERTKLLDFGIAKLTEQALAGGQLRTSTGAMLGTPLYMAPEQCRDAGRVNDRTDVYAVGVMFYQMLAGEPPFPATSSLGDLLLKHLTEAPPPLRERDPAIPEPLARLVHHMLAKSVEERPAMRDVVAALGDSQAMAGGVAPPPPPFAPVGPPPAAPPRSGRRALIGGVTAAVVIVAAAAGVILAQGGGDARGADAGATANRPATVPAAPVMPRFASLPRAAPDAAMAPPPAAPAPAPPPKTAPPATVRKAPPRERPAPVREAPPREAPPREAVEPAVAFKPRQVWRGQYQCAQGTTGLTVTISAVNAHRVSAVFAFHHPPTGAAGSYRLLGDYDRTTRQIVFQPGAWIQNPASYHAVGMSGRLTADGHGFAGRITDPACGAFQLRLQ